MRCVRVVLLALFLSQGVWAGEGVDRLAWSGAEFDFLRLQRLSERSPQPMIDRIRGELGARVVIVSAGVGSGPLTGDEAPAWLETYYTDFFNWIADPLTRRSAKALGGMFLRPHELEELHPERPWLADPVVVLTSKAGRNEILHEAAHLIRWIGLGRPPAPRPPELQPGQSESDPVILEGMADYLEAYVADEVDVVTEIVERAAELRLTRREVADQLSVMKMRLGLFLKLLPIPPDPYQAKVHAAVAFARRGIQGQRPEIGSRRVSLNLVGSGAP